MTIWIPEFLLNRYGSKKGLIKHFYFLLAYISGFRFGTNKVAFGDIDRIVYVCKGNICRSALADVLTKESGKIQSVSFGLDTTPGNSANDRFSGIAKSKGINMSKHMTTDLSGYTNRSKDLLVCMEPWQSKVVRKMFPEANITLIGLYGPSFRAYLHDPFSANDRYAEYCVSYIKKSVSNLLLALA